MGRWFIAAVCSVALGCSSQSAKIGGVLPPPTGTTPAAATQIEKGNALFTSRDFTGAEAAFRQAIVVDAGSAEAHYNLALVYDFLRDDATAKHHYIEAANLAPGHKVIWDAPPLRRHGEVEAHPKGSDTQYLPAFGGR